MPGAVSYIPATDKERDSFRAELRDERTARRTAYRTAVRYYGGDHDNQLATDPDIPDDNVRINLVKMTADRTVSFLFPTVPDFKTDKSIVEETPEEAYLRGFWKANGGLKVLVKLGLRSFLAGHGYLRVKPVPERRREYRKYPTLSVLDPTSVSVYWQADDVAEILWYEQRYVVGSTPYLRDFVRQIDDTWRIYTYRGVTRTPEDKLVNIPTPHGEPIIWFDDMEFTGSNFELEGKPAIHQSTIPPIIDFAHLPHPDDYYGMSGFTEKDLQDTINRIASERNRIVRENSDPVDVLTGSDGDDLNTEGGIVTIENDRARITRLEMRGDLSGITTVLDKLIETYLAIARVVLLKGEAKDLQRVTNAAVRTLFLDAISQNTILQSTYGAALAQTSELALQMAYEAGQLDSNPQDIEVAVEFGSALPIDLTEIANINALAINNGYRTAQQAAEAMNQNWAETKEGLETEHTWRLEKFSLPEEPKSEKSDVGD